MNRIAAATAVASLAVAGCTTTNPNYAGMTKDEAREQMQNGMAKEFNDPNSPLYHRLFVFRRMRRGKTLSGRKAWVGVYANAVGERICFRVYAVKAPFGSSYYTEVDECRGEPSAPAPATTGSPA